MLHAQILHQPDHVLRQPRIHARQRLDLDVDHHADRLGMMVNIEINALPRMYAGLTKDVVGLVQDLRMEHRVLISSFDHEQLLEVRRWSNRIATGVLTVDRIARPGDYLALLDADAYNPGCYGDYDS